MRIIELAVLSGLYWIPSSAFAEDWAEWLGPTRDGVSAEKGWLKDWPPEGPPRLFEKPIGEGYSGLSVASGRLILYHRVKDTNVLESLDPLTGKPQWRFEEPADYTDAYGYNGGPRSQPLVHKDGDRSLVFALCPRGVLNALDLSTGKKVWRRDLQGEFRIEPFFFGVGVAPFLEGDHLIMNLGGADLGSGMAFCLDRRDGRLVWKTPTDGGSYATARTADVGGARQLFLFHRGGLSCLDPADGREKWKFPWVSRIYESVNAATPLIAGDLLFLSATYGTGGALLRVKKDSHEVLWKDEPSRREKSIETHWSTASLADGFLYGFSGRHEQGSDLRCVELETGKVRWKWESYLGRGSMIGSDGHFIALGERGDLTLLVLGPGGHEEKRRVKRILSYPAWTPPTLSGGLLYLRDERRLICLDLRKAGG
ncbi:MAG TPA: PQQ-binding-like beta-propeller repeat protein [Planctomycetota bacterium]|nr:PQQ-binding-like beta-propeller repeat protein [Planctomycetota bacterium]